MEIAPGIYSMEQSKGGHVHAFLLDDGTFVDRAVVESAHLTLALANREHAT